MGNMMAVSALMGSQYSCTTFNSLIIIIVMLIIIIVTLILTTLSS